jgi:PAS domain S-box-containing protein
MENSVRSVALISKLKTFTRRVAIFAMLVGSVVLLGWLLDITSLKILMPGLASMKANTAACLALCGVSLWLMSKVRQSETLDENRARIAGRFVGIVVASVGLATLAEYLLRRNFGIDQLLFVDRLGDGHSIPGRMAPHTALCFVTLGLALVLIHVETKRGFRPAQFLSLAPAFISLMAMLGYLYSVVSFYRITSFTGMALHTAATLFVLSLGIFFFASDRGLAAIFSSDSFGGIVVRRLLPATFLVPIVIGWFRMEGQRAGWYGTEFGLALMVTVNVTIFSVVIYLSAREIDRIAMARQEAESALRTSQDGLLAMNYTFESVIDACPLPIVTLDQESKIQVWNQAAEKFYGWSWMQVRGRPFFLAPKDRREELASIIEILQQGDPVAGIQTVLLRSDDTRVPIVLWAAPIVVGAKGFSGSVLIMEDATRQKQLEAALEAANRKVRKDEPAIHNSDESLKALNKS